MIYNPSQIGDDQVRYALVQEGKRTLFVIGLNPSTADASKPDPTMKAVMRIAEFNGYDGFVIVNLYPQRATFPKDLPKEYDEHLHKSNLANIEELLKGRSSVDVWLAYGANVSSRKYLISCFEGIVKMFAPHNPKWYYIGTLTKNGLPKHPLYQKTGFLNEYNIKI